MWYLVVLFVVSPAVHCGNIRREHVVGRRDGFDGEDSRTRESTCQCVPSNFCADNEVEINGEGLLDVRNEDSQCPNYFEICCENPTNYEEEIILEENEFKGCGYRSINIIPRITSDSSQAQFGELPWTVIVLTKDPAMSGKNLYKCGGSLIHPKVVLTAAHCVFDSHEEFLTIRAGEWNTQALDEPIPHQDLPVEEIVLHPDFHRVSLKNDVALLFVSEPFIMVDNIGIVCLPLSDYNFRDLRCTAGGWGKNTFNQGKHNAVLKKVELPLVERDKCIPALRRTRLGPSYYLHKSFICAGGEQNKDTCKGDGGSPLVCPIPGQPERFFQIGIVSWGIGCGDNGIPGVYVNVPVYVFWIDRQLTARNLDTEFYKYS